MAKLDGKIALISGGTSGIGAAAAKLFQSEGATVIVTGSSQKSVDAAKGELPGVEAIVSNAADVAATKALVDQVKAEHGRIDVLFVNAGIAKFAPIEVIDEAFFDSQFDVNVKGSFPHQACDPGDPRRRRHHPHRFGGGRGRRPWRGHVYGATKAALRSLGRTLAKELVPRGIRVNTISPGPIITPILDKNGLTAAQKDAFIEGAKTANSPRPHRNGGRGGRRRPLPRRRRHLHHRGRTLRRRRSHRSLTRAPRRAWRRRQGQPPAASAAAMTTRRRPRAASAADRTRGGRGPGFSALSPNRQRVPATRFPVARVGRRPGRAP